MPYTSTSHKENILSQDIYILILIDEADRTAVDYVCLWEGTSSGSKFLHPFNACYHMVGRSSEVSLSRFGNIKMEKVNDNNGSYDVDMQGIDRTKTRTYQEVCIYPEKEYFLYDWYWSMAYTCIIDTSNKEYIFPEFAKLFARVGIPELIPGSPLCFKKYMNIFINLFRNTEKVSKIYLQ